MAIWRSGNLSGYDSSEIEIAGKFLGWKPGWVLFHDGIGKPRWYSVARVRQNLQRSSITMPMWLYLQRSKFCPVWERKPKQEKRKRIHKGTDKQVGR